MISEVNFDKNLLINNRELKYKGIFRVDELFSTINRAIEGRDYVKREKKSEEVVTETGRKTYLELRPYKTINNYITLMIKIKLTLDNITEIIDEVKDERLVYQQGDVNISFDAWLLTDYNYRWGMKPWFYFVKSLVNKFLYKNPIEAGAGGTLAADTAYIYAKIKTFLNSYGEKEKKFVKEEDIKKEIKKEITKK